MHNIVIAAGFANPFKFNTLQEFLYVILETVVLFLFPFIVLMIVYTGFLFVTAQGNPEKLTKARQALLWTVIGAVVVLGSFALAELIKATVESVINP